MAGLGLLNSNFAKIKASLWPLHARWRYPSIFLSTSLRSVSRCSSGPTGGAGAEVWPEKRSVGFFVPRSHRCAVHFSTTSRAETAGTEDKAQHQHQHRPLSQIQKILRSSYRRKQVKDRRKGKSFRRRSERIKLVKAEIIALKKSSPSLPAHKCCMTVSAGVYLRFLCLLKPSSGSFTKK